MKSLESLESLSDARRELERTLWELRHSLGKSFGMRITGRYWALPLLATASALRAQL